MAVKEAVTATESHGWAQEASKDGSARFFEDQEIRSKGFEIHARPNKGPILWIRNRLVYTQEEVLNRFCSAPDDKC